ncbi:MAG: hypothetical protein WBA54_03975 [Acidaminobacteraceae bacterium]
MNETFEFNQENFIKSLLVNILIQVAVFAVVVIVFAKTFETTLLYVFMLGSMIVYMWNLNLSYNPISVKFSGTDLTLLRKNFMFKEYETLYDANQMIKTTVSKRDNSFHSVIFLHQFNERKAMPVKIHLKHINEPEKFVNFLHAHFRNMHEAEIKR